MPRVVYRRLKACFLGSQLDRGRCRRLSAVCGGDENPDGDAAEVAGVLGLLRRLSRDLCILWSDLFCQSADQCFAILLIFFVPIHISIYQIDIKK